MSPVLKDHSLFSVRSACPESWSGLPSDLQTHCDSLSTPHACRNKLPALRLLCETHSEDCSGSELCFFFVELLTLFVVVGNVYAV